MRSLHGHKLAIWQVDGSALPVTINGHASAVAAVNFAHLWTEKTGSDTCRRSLLRAVTRLVRRALACALARQAWKMASRVGDGLPVGRHHLHVLREALEQLH